MKIKGRLITAFFILIMVPVILIAASAGVIIHYQVISFQDNFDLGTDTLQIFSNPVQILNRMTRGAYNELKTYSEKTPERLEDRAFLDTLNTELKERFSFIAVKKGDTFIYEGDPRRLLQVRDTLPEFGYHIMETEGGIYTGDKNPFLIKKQDFYFNDGSQGSAFIITDVNTIKPRLKSTAVQMIASFLIIILLTALLLILWIYQGILRPLNMLREATNKMKEGDLNFSIHRESDDEIGMLCDDFEEMRIRLKELIEVRLQYEEDSRELISNISHDLKTPLTAIKGYAEGLLDGVADTEEKQKRYVKTIYNKANDMTVLVDELSIYSKIDCDTVPYSFADVNLERYFTDCINELTLDLEVKKIELGYFNYTEPDLKVIADREQLKRVINNIINNSVKYIGKKKGIINVRIKDAEDFVTVEIEDNGKGIAKKDLSNIFERFYRTDASRNSAQGGSGLGLAIARKIIEDHGGRIWAESREEVGTSIFFTLKKTRDCQEKEPKQEKELPEPPHGKNLGKIKH